MSEQLLAGLRAREADVEADFAALAQAITMGELIDNTKAQAVLQAAGKSVADLERDVARLKKIKELESIIATHDELAQQEAERAQKRSEEIDAERDEREALQEKHNAAAGVAADAATLYRVKRQQMEAAQQELAFMLNLPEPVKQTPQPGEGMGLTTEEDAGITPVAASPQESAYRPAGRIA